MPAIGVREPYRPPVQYRVPTVQAQALRNPPPIQADTAPNPYQTEAYADTKAGSDASQAAVDSAAAYERDLTGAEPEFARREMGRFRDELSVGLAKEGQGAMSRGADPGLARTKLLQGAQTAGGNLQARLADVALQRREGAVNTRISAANARTGAGQGRVAGAQAVAGEQRLMHLGTIQARIAEEDMLTRQAEVQARLQAAPYDRLAALMQTVAQNQIAVRPTYGLAGPGAHGTLGRPSPGESYGR